MFYVQTDDPKIKAAALRASEFFEELYKGGIAVPEYFTHTSLTPAEIAFRLRRRRETPTNVRTYRTWNPWSNVLGYTSKGMIYVNTRFSDRADISAIAGNLAHEFCHIAGFSHKGNRPTPYNLKSVPYVLGYACRDWVASK